MSAQFEVINGVAYYRPVGEFAFNEVMAIVSDAVAACHHINAFKILIDTTGLTGFNVPDTYERFFFAERLAANAKGVVVAIVARKEMIDPRRFGSTVARNRGALAEIFSIEQDALDWLSSIGR